MTALRFATIGDNCIDRFLPLGVAAVGGNAANVAAQLALAGQDCRYYGAVGRDEAGDWTLAALRRAGVGLDHLHRLDAPTAWTDLDTDPTGDRIIGHEEFGACAIYQPTDEDLSALAGADHLHIGWFPRAPRMIEALAPGGPTLSQDLTVNPEHAGLDLGFTSAGDDPDKARAMIERMLAKGCRVAVVTCGAAGSLASDGGETVSMKAAPVQVVDTTGAGDTFIAHFILAWKQGRPLPDCLAAGSKAAAHTCTHIGGFPQPVTRLPGPTERQLTDV